MRHLEATPSIFAKFEKEEGIGPGMNWNRQRALCSLYFLSAEMMVAAGSASHARSCWKEARSGAWRVIGSTCKAWLYWR